MIVVAVFTASKLLGAHGRVGPAAETSSTVCKDPEGGPMTLRFIVARIACATLHFHEHRKRWIIGGSAERASQAGRRRSNFILHAKKS